jgi:hypothetical protein
LIQLTNLQDNGKKDNSGRGGLKIQIPRPAQEDVLQNVKYEHKVEKLILDKGNMFNLV